MPSTIPDAENTAIQDKVPGPMGHIPAVRAGADSQIHDTISGNIEESKAGMRTGTMEWTVSGRMLREGLVREPGLFCLTHNKQKHCDDKVCSKERVYSQDTQDRRTSFKSASLKARGLGIYEIKNKTAGWSEAWGAWGVWGKAIGKRCSNCPSAQV